MIAGLYLKSTLLAIALIVAAFAGGYILTAKYMPGLRNTRSGTIGNVLVRSLVGAASVFAVLSLYDLGATLQLYGDITPPDEFLGSDASAIASTVLHIFWYSALLLAAAGVIWYLGPPEEEDD